MCEPITAGTLMNVALGASVIGTGISAYGTMQQGKVASQVARNNQMVANQQAQDAERRGEQDAQDIARKAAALKGTQRATMAARGLDLTEGSPADLLEQTDFFSLADQATARNNARKEAWAYRVQGVNAANSGKTGAGLNAFSTLLGGAGSVADQWYRYRRG